ncbi:kinesin-like protein KIF16B [Vanacampus margaritifer]
MASVRVAVRVRPMNRREKDLAAKCIIKMDATRTSISNPKLSDGTSGDPSKTFTYDFSYDSADARSSAFVSQEKVFLDLGRDVLKAAFEGYNACVLAYGQTGSGKSYTMMGNPGDAGLTPRICQGLFSRIADAARRDQASFRTEVSYLEIYNERVRDLLRRKPSETYNLRVREHPKDGPYVEDLSKHLVQNYSDVEELMEAGNLKRTTASTGMNHVSSRSHAIFTLNFTQAKFDAEMPSETLSKIHLVDLAGSERADATGATGVRLKEGANINKSLVTLGNVISALADLCGDANANGEHKRKSLFVPYRDSVLTWLLKDSLGGNSKTIMIATVSPADVNYGETLGTLRYANRAKNIINKPTVNEDANVRLIRELRAEIARLKALLLQGSQIALLDSPTALSVEEKLHQNEARVLELTMEWTNKWNETQNILKEETLALRKEGIGVVLDSELPHLLGIDDDLLSTGIILYHLKEGRTYVGRQDGASEQDIVVHGADVEREHCVFENRGGSVTLVPLGAALCSVNGGEVATPTQLNQGAVVLLGRTNMFRFNHPKEAAKLREKRKSGLLSSFSLSMSDLSKSCDNLSAVLLYNPGLELERQQREELDKLETSRRLIKETEAQQQSEKAKLQRLQQEVESRRKESEEARRRILRQEESLRRRSQDMESRLRDFLQEKQRFEKERRSDLLLEQRRQKEAQDEELDRELDKLKRESQEAQLRDEERLAVTAMSREDAGRLQEEKRALAAMREALLCGKEATEAAEETSQDQTAVYDRYLDLKAAQVQDLARLASSLQERRARVAQEVAEEVAEQRVALRLVEEGPSEAFDNEQSDACRTQQLRSAQLQLSSLDADILPALAQEKRRAQEAPERNGNHPSPPGLDKLLHRLEKELEEKEEKLKVHRASVQHPQQLQETFGFAAVDVALQEDKVRCEDKEILEAAEQALDQLQGRHSAPRCHVSPETDTQDRGMRTGPELDLHTSESAGPVQPRMTRPEIQKSSQRFSEVEENIRTSADDKTPAGHVQNLDALVLLSDDRINLYIEEEVQRRLRQMNLNGTRTRMDLALSCESLQEENPGEGRSTEETSPEGQDREAPPILDMGVNKRTKWWPRAKKPRPADPSSTRAGSDENKSADERPSQSLSRCRTGTSSPGCEERPGSDSGSTLDLLVGTLSAASRSAGDVIHNVPDVKNLVVRYLTQMSKELAVLLAATQTQQEPPEKPPEKSPEKPPEKPPDEPSKPTSERPREEPAKDEMLEKGVVESLKPGTGKEPPRSKESSKEPCEEPLKGPQEPSQKEQQSKGPLKEPVDLSKELLQQRTVEVEPPSRGKPSEESFAEASKEAESGETIETVSQVNVNGGGLPLPVPVGDISCDLSEGSACGVTSCHPHIFRQRLVPMPWPLDRLHSAPPPPHAGNHGVSGAAHLGGLSFGRLLASGGHVGGASPTRGVPAGVGKAADVDFRGRFCPPKGIRAAGSSCCSGGSGFC